MFSKGFCLRVVKNKGSSDHSPNTKILDWFKLKAFADNKRIVNQKYLQLIGVKNSMVKIY